MDKYYVVTKYWNNGESWGDERHVEEPIAVYEDLDSLQKDIRDGNYTSLSCVDEEYLDYVYEFKEIEDEEESFECPYNKDYYDCELECLGGYYSYDDYINGNLDEYMDIGTYKECNNYTDSLYDNSYIVYYVYEVSNSLKED